MVFQNHSREVGLVQVAVAHALGSDTLYIDHVLLHISPQPIISIGVHLLEVLVTCNAGVFLRNSLDLQQCALDTAHTRGWIGVQQVEALCTPWSEQVHANVFCLNLEEADYSATRNSAIDVLHRSVTWDDCTVFGLDWRSGFGVVVGQ